MGRHQRRDTGGRDKPMGRRDVPYDRQGRPRTATEQSAYDRRMDQTIDREQARNERVHSMEGIIPLPLWLALFVICGVIFGYILFFADRGESAVTQGMLIGSVTIVITLLMLLVIFFNHPTAAGWAACSQQLWNERFALSMPS
jgi:hypothetical protein